MYVWYVLFNFPNFNKSSPVVVSQTLQVFHHPLLAKANLMKRSNNSVLVFGGAVVVLYPGYSWKCTMKKDISLTYHMIIHEIGLSSNINEIDLHI